MSILLFGIYFVTFYGWKFDYPDKDSLHKVSGVIESVKENYVRRARDKLVIQIMSDSGLHHLSIDDFRTSVPAIKTLQQGDEINTLVTADSLGREIEWIWEIHRGEEIILSHEQMLELIKPGTLQSILSFIALVLAIFLFLFAIILRIRYRAWASWSHKRNI